MDQGLKERLVGAAVLVAIGVWLIPWVLDGPESPLDTGANSLQLPAAAEEPLPMRTQTLHLGGASETPAVEAESETPATQDPVPAVVEVPAPVVESPPTVTAPATVAATNAPAPPPPKPVASAPAASTPTAAKGDWVVQLGSFGEEANARRLAQRAATFGYKANVSSYRSNGRTMYRVRVGPFEARGKADATASALSAHGLVAQVVAAN